jgi:hypothetical protein
MPVPKSIWLEVLSTSKVFGLLGTLARLPKEVNSRGIAMDTAGVELFDELHAEEITSKTVMTSAKYLFKCIATLPIYRLIIG